MFDTWEDCHKAGWTASPAGDRWIITHDADNVCFQAGTKADAVETINALNAPKPVAAVKPEVDSELTGFQVLS